MSIEAYIENVPAFVRWLLAVIVTAGITVAMVKVFYQRTLAFNSVDEVASDARKARNKSAEAEADENGTEPVLEPPLPSPMYNLSGRLLALASTAFVFLLAFTFSNFWQNSKAAISATQAEAAYFTQAYVQAKPIPAEQGGTKILDALDAYQTSVTQTQWPMMQRGDAEGSYRAELIAGLDLGKALLEAQRAGASDNPTWDGVTSAVSNMLEQGRYRIDALPGRAAPGGVAVVFMLGISTLALTSIFQPARIGANLAIMAIMGGIVGTLLFVVVETSNPYLGSTAISWPDFGPLITSSAPPSAATP